MAHLLALAVIRKYSGFKRVASFSCLYLLLPLLLISPHLANASWSKVWSENFDTKLDIGMNLKTFHSSDRLTLRAGGPEGGEGYMLAGESRVPTTGHGYRASSPSFKDLGLNPWNPYRISFQYMVPDNCFSWTYVMATRDVSLVLSSCDDSGTKAQFGVVDQNHQNFQSLGTLDLGQWHSIDVVVYNRLSVKPRKVRIIVDGVLRGVHERVQPSTYDRFLFMDLPVRIADPDLINPNAKGCFGSGNWDNIEIWSRQDQPLPPGKPIYDFRIAPNPLNPSTSVKFDMRASGQLNVDVYDISGRHVCSLFGGYRERGPIDLIWRGRDASGIEVSSGVYLIRAATPLGIKTSRAVVVR